MIEFAVFCDGYIASRQSSFSGAVKHALACIGNNDLVHVGGSVQWQRRLRDIHACTKLTGIQKRKQPIT